MLLNVQDGRRNECGTQGQPTSLVPVCCRQLDSRVLQLIADQLSVREWARGFARASRELHQITPAELVFEPPPVAALGNYTGQERYEQVRSSPYQLL